MDTDSFAKALTPDTANIFGSELYMKDLTRLSESSARYIAQNLEERISIVEALQEQLEAQLWFRLGELWSGLAGRFVSKDLDVRGDSEDNLIGLGLGLAKFERNLLAGLEEHQAAAISHEESIRAVLFHITTFSRIEDEKYFTLQAIATQLLSNLISPIRLDEEEWGPADYKLATYLSGEREADIISRLLDSKDIKTNLSTVHLLSNLTRSSPRRCKHILSKAPGISWLSRSLDKLGIFHDSPIDGSEKCFDLIVQFFTTFIDFNLHPRLFGVLCSAEEPITPSQTALLKVIDGNNHQQSAGNDINVFLVPVFRDLSAYCVTSIRSGADDPRLPKVFEGLHMACGILCAEGLAVQAAKDAGDAGDSQGAAVVTAMKARGQGEGVIVPAITLLRELETLLPRTNPRLARTASVPPLIPAEQARPIAQLKRVLVELLGILTFGDTAIGDQVREAGGVQLVLGMTEMDEQNPYLREHALLVVRNLMMGNPANQALIGQMDPVGVLDQNGELLPVPERLTRHGQL